MVQMYKEYEGSIGKQPVFQLENRKQLFYHLKLRSFFCNISNLAKQKECFTHIFKSESEIITTKTSICLCIQLYYTRPNLKIWDSNLNSTTLTPQGHPVTPRGTSGGFGLKKN